MKLAAVPDVTVAVVTWNSAEHLPGLLEALTAALTGLDSWRLVVADNGSTDGTLERLAELAPEATRLALGRNLGFAGGVNACMEACRPRHAALLLNPDVRSGAGAARHLLDTLSLPGTGIAVPRLVGPDGRLHHSLRREPTVLRVLGQAFLGRSRAGRIGPFGEVITDSGRYDRQGTVDWASGAMMMVSRRCLDAVGPWDESFFLYSEETDFALRARDLGFSTRYAPEAVAIHLGGESDYSQRLWTILTVNRVRLFRRRHGPLSNIAFWTAVLVNEGLRGLLPGRPEHRAAVKALLQPAHRREEITK